MYLSIKKYFFINFCPIFLIVNDLNKRLYQDIFHPSRLVNIFCRNHLAIFCILNITFFYENSITRKIRLLIRVVAFNLNNGIQVLYYCIPLSKEFSFLNSH